MRGWSNLCRPNRKYEMHRCAHIPSGSNKAHSARIVNQSKVARPFMLQGFQLLHLSAGHIAKSLHAVES